MNSRIPSLLILLLSFQSILGGLRPAGNDADDVTARGTMIHTASTEVVTPLSSTRHGGGNEQSSANTVVPSRSTARQPTGSTSPSSRSSTKYKTTLNSVEGGAVHGNISVEIEEQFIKVYEDTDGRVVIKFTGVKEVIHIQLFSKDENVFVVLNDSIRFDPNDHDEHNSTLTVCLRGDTLGVSSLLLVVYDHYEEVILRDDVRFTVKTFRIPRLIDKIFDYLLLPLIVVSCAGMGCRMDIEIIRGKLKKPISILVGPICQFISQPFFAFVISRFIMKFDGLTALGLVTVGSCPGGGMSNMITLLIGADLIQSITMTFTSNVCALGMLPLNMFLYGSYFLQLIVEEGGDGASFKIPITDIIFQIAMLAGPILLGMFLRYKVPKVAHYINKSLGVISMTLLLLTLGIGVYSNFYVLTSSGWQMMVGAALLPIFGFITGFLVARLLTRQPLDSSMTVSVETGVQNNLIAISMIKLAYPQPEADMMARLPIIVSITALTCGIGMVLASYPIHRIRKYRKELKERQWTDSRYDGVHYEEMSPKKRDLKLQDETAPSVASYSKVDDEEDDE